MRDGAGSGVRGPRCAGLDDEGWRPAGARSQACMLAIRWRLDDLSMIMDAVFNQNCMTAPRDQSQQIGLLRVTTWRSKMVQNRLCHKKRVIKQSLRGKLAQNRPRLFFLGSRSNLASDPFHTGSLGPEEVRTL